MENRCLLRFLNVRLRIGCFVLRNFCNVSFSNVFQVCTEGRLILEFTFDDLMRIKSWHLSVRTHRELIPRSVVGHGPDHAVLDQLSKNITRQGITTSTLNYLRVCLFLYVIN